MTDNVSWSASAGRWMGIPVRVHLLLFLFVAVIFGVQTNYSSQNVLGTAMVTSLCLVVCILLHELAHVFALTNVGGLVNNIILTPWGGNSDFSLPEDTRGKAVVFLAGPFFSGCLFVLGWALLAQTGHATLDQLTNPFHPLAFELNQPAVTILKIVSWINFQLLIVNLIPCFPFDGAGLLRVIVNRITSGASMLRREATLLVVGQATGLTMIGCSWFLSGYEVGPIQPVWLLLLVAGLTLIFSARHSYHQQIALLDDGWDDAEDLDYDSICGDSSYIHGLESENANYSQWLIEKQEERDRIDREQEEREESVADEILKKLHREGIDSLSDEEKGILNRFSARLRLRRQQGV